MRGIGDSAESRHRQAGMAERFEAPQPQGAAYRPWRTAVPGQALAPSEEGGLLIFPPVVDLDSRAMNVGELLGLGGNGTA